MKNILENEVEKELNNIYGIGSSKWEILNYAKYLEISNENHFANYNIIIHNNSEYPSETKNKLVEFLYEILKKNNIIEDGYEFITTDDIGKKEIKSDLIIIDSEKIISDFDEYRDKIIEMMINFKDKVFIIIDKSYCVGEVNALFNKYFDWFFQINEISEENKKDYINNILKENQIAFNDECNYINDLIKEPFFIVKPKMNHIILQCKINNIKIITDEIVEKCLKDEKNQINKEKEKSIKKQETNLNFDSLIGIDNIKAEINKIVNYVKVCKKRKNKLPMLHMCFTGNPGTGKTTVARIIGKIFKEENILSKGEFIEIHGRDLVGQYIGWTAKEVKNYIKRAKGGVLFIDEAYSLNSDRKGSFEDEAIATLIKEMEDNRNDLCVILAGYQDEMNDLIKRNPGFESRIQFYINFPNYDEDKLYAIFKNLAKEEEYKISSHVKESLIDDFRQKIINTSFSNGRYVRNIYEKVKIEQANRVSLDRTEDINLIKKCDIERVLSCEEKVEKTKFKIGFAV